MINCLKTLKMCDIIDDKKGEITITGNGGEM